LERNVRKALHQFRGSSADLNLVALSVSRLINAGDPSKIPDVPDRERGHVYLQSRLLAIAQKTSRFSLGKVSRTGVLLYSFVPLRCPQGPQYFCDRCESMFSLSEIDELNSTLLRCLAQGLNQVPQH